MDIMGRAHEHNFKPLLYIANHLFRHLGVNICLASNFGWTLVCWNTRITRLIFFQKNSPRIQPTALFSRNVLEANLNFLKKINSTFIHLRMKELFHY